MSSRSKRKQTIAERMQFQSVQRSLENAKANEKAKLDEAMKNAKESISAFRSVMDYKDESFRRGVNARQNVLELIDRSDALKKHMDEVYVLSGFYRNIILIK